MEEDVKKRWYLIFYIICLIIFLSNIPFSFFIKDKVLLFVLSLIFEVIAIIVLFFQMKKEKLFYKQNPIDYKNILIFSPTILICFSNLIVLKFQQSSSVSNIDVLNLIFTIILTVINVIIEEMLFRYILQHEFDVRNGKFKSILYSSLIFGSMHLLNITSIYSIPICLLQTLYTFGLGMVLGIVFLFSKNILFPIILHMMFNLFNNIIVSTFFILEWNYIFFTVNILISIIMILYLLFVYKFLSRENRENVA